MLYQIQDGTVSLGGETVLSHFDFEIRSREKIAVVGKNGAGKTTLLRLLAGELELDRDDKRKNPGIRTSRRVTVGFLTQQVFSEEYYREKENCGKNSEKSCGKTIADRTVEEELLRACPCKDTWDKERFDYEQEYDRLFTGFGFRKEDKSRKLSEFSGGQRTRIALIRLMLEKPDILLLDEPTNHLDQEMTEWLETWISGYEKAVVIVSHDRYFLDQTAEVVYEITGKKLVRYAGNYSRFVEQKQKNLQIQRKEWERQQEEVERLDGLIRKFRNKPRKAAFARSRQKLLERMEKLEKPSDGELRPFIQEIKPQVVSAKYVLEAEKLQIGYDYALLEISLRIRRGQKIGVIGPNGIGKSTFLKTAAGILPPVKGKCVLGQRVVMEYFDQQTASIQAEGNVKEHFHRLYPSLTEKEVRSVLGRWLFGGKDAAKPVGELSGGEKSRLIFAEMFQSCPNFMILDEPTNHMDIPAKEMLESAFRAYQGTLLFVSHDRYFISRTADALLVFEKDRVLYYPFGYRHYQERLRRARVYADESAGLKNGNSGRTGNAMSDGTGNSVSDSSGNMMDDGELLGIAMRAEDKALVEDMRNVPEAEKGRFQTISTEQAYRDWMRRFMEEELEQAAKQVQELSQEWENWKQLEMAVELGYEADVADKPETADRADGKEGLQAGAQADGEEKLALALKLWTEKCLEWDEEFSEENPAKYR